MTSLYTLQSDSLQTQPDYLLSKYTHSVSEVTMEGQKYKIVPKNTDYTFKTCTKVPKLGVMLVGLGGNNGTTFLGGVLANKMNITWNTKKGVNQPNFYGSITQCSTTKIGIMKDTEVYLPLRDILPLVDPSELVIHGWDISAMNMGDALARAEVFDYDLQQKLYPLMKDVVPLPSIYYPDFIAGNQKDRADNVLAGDNKKEHLERIRKDIRDFKEKNGLDKVVVLWTANTERYSEVQEGVHDTAENLLKAIERSEKEVSPSTIFAVASILEGTSFINGSPQNALVEGVIDLANKHNVFIVGNDFKTGQTKIKTVLADFLVSAGIKPRSIVSYNHLGNNDGKNLSSGAQFKSKELSKKSCVDDILNSNKTLYPADAAIDHEIVIKYVPTAGDTKKAMDEYISDIFMNGTHTLTIYNVCEDSLLAAPLILDLILLTEVMERIQYKQGTSEEFKRFDPVLSMLGYLMKAPMTKEGHPLINSLARQKACIENLFKACAGIPLDDNLLLEFRANQKVFQQYTPTHTHSTNSFVSLGFRLGLLLGFFSRFVCFFFNYKSFLSAIDDLLALCALFDCSGKNPVLCVLQYMRTLFQSFLRGHVLYYSQ
eukprot:TRINITY_DN9453_c0_g1_i2.p1 TRINITY_DN9453_c0_g1~~TRINITY_DN9453_c0_g1_i2.p1  ORF type:complete len:600 (-),score=255.32 TRINITY_DN9453_c0_g1_i2:748-2547(-)